MATVSLGLDDLMNSKEALEYLNIDKKAFENYFKKSGEIKAFKQGGRWKFKKKDLDEWNYLKNHRIITLTLEEYEKCFEFAMKVVYGGSAMFGLGRSRSEMQAVDNWILGILVEVALKKLLKKNFNFDIILDDAVHPGRITPKDIVGIKKNGKISEPKKFIGVKGSKWKSAYLIADEHGKTGRSADIYIFGRVNLPSDHLFRILRDHSFFKNVKEFLEKNESFRKLKELKEVDVWICGYTISKELELVNSIPGQDFRGTQKYVRSVAKMHNSDGDWERFIQSL